MLVLRMEFGTETGWKTRMKGPNTVDIKHKPLTSGTTGYHERINCRRKSNFQSKRWQVST